LIRAKMADKARLRVAIVGGGIAGLTLANALEVSLNARARFL
jgi:cation diffusion facilitator CzcD-associated flavoprotein CzcO